MFLTLREYNPRKVALIPQFPVSFRPPVKFILCMPGGSSDIVGVQRRICLPRMVFFICLVNPELRY
jgi:hypothetical protein